MPIRLASRTIAAALIVGGYLGLAAVCAAQPAPAPTVTIKTMAVTEQAPPSPDAPSPVGVTVRISAAGKELWAGDLNVQIGQAAEMTMTMQEAEPECSSAGAPRYFGKRQTMLRFSLRQRPGREEGQPFGVMATWTRASPDCAQPGTRTVGIDTAVPIEPGAKQVISADGGLTIELSRRN